MSLEGASIVVLKRNGNEGNVFTTKTDTISIGTDVRCDIRIHKPGVEPFHCIIKREGREVVIRNQSVSDPTLVNNAEFESRTLHDCDQINVCGSLFTWKMPKTVLNRRWTTYLADNKKKKDDLASSRKSCAIPSTSALDDELPDTSEASSKQVAVVKPLVRRGIGDSRNRNASEQRNNNPPAASQPNLLVNSSVIAAEHRPISLEDTTDNAQDASTERPTVAVEGISTFRRIQYPRPDPNRRRVRNYIAMSIGPMIRRQLLVTPTSDSSDSGSVRNSRNRTRTAPSTTSRSATNANDTRRSLPSSPVLELRPEVTASTSSSGRRRNASSNSTSSSNSSTRQSRNSSHSPTPIDLLPLVPSVLINSQPSTSGQTRSRSSVSQATSSSVAVSSSNTPATKRKTSVSRKSTRLSKSAKKSPIKSKIPVGSTNKTKKTNSNSISVKKVKLSLARKTKSPPSNKKLGRKSKSPASTSKVKIGSKRKLYNDVIANKRRKVQTPLPDKKKKAALMVLASSSSKIQSRTPNLLNARVEKRNSPVKSKTPFKVGNRGLFSTPISTLKQSTQVKKSPKSVKTAILSKRVSSVSAKKQSAVKAKTPKNISTLKTPKTTVKLLKSPKQVKTPASMKAVRETRKSIKSNLNSSTNQINVDVQVHTTPGTSERRRQSTRQSSAKVVHRSPVKATPQKIKSPHTKLDLTADIFEIDNEEAVVKTPDRNNSDSESIKTTPLHRSEKDLSIADKVYHFDKKSKLHHTLSEPRVRVARLSTTTSTVNNIKRNIEKRLSLNIERYVDTKTTENRKIIETNLVKDTVNKFIGSKSEPRVNKRGQVAFRNRKTINGKISPTNPTKKEKIVTPKTNVKLVAEVVKKQHSTAKKPINRKSVSSAVSMRSKMIKGMFNSPELNTFANLSYEDEGNSRMESVTLGSPCVLLQQSSKMNVQNDSSKDLSTEKKPTPKRMSRALRNVTSPQKSKLRSNRKSLPLPRSVINDLSPKRLVRSSKSLAAHVKIDVSNKGGVKQVLTSPIIHEESATNRNILDTSIDLFEQSLIDSDFRNVSGVTPLPLEETKINNSKTFSRSVKSLTASKRYGRTYNSPKNDLTNVAGVKRLFGTPKPIRSPKNDLTNVAGVKRLLGTPKLSGTPKNDLTDVRGVKRLMRSGKRMNTPKNDLTNVAGVKRLLGTPKPSGSPKNDLTNVAGVKRLLGSPKPSGSPKNDLTNIAGVKRLMRSAKRMKSPKNDLTNVQGVKRLLRSPKNLKSPKNDLRNIHGVKKLLKTPRPHPKSPKNDLTQASGIRNLYASPRPFEISPKNDLSNVNSIENLFDEDNSNTIETVGQNNSSKIVNVDVEDPELEFDALLSNKPIIRKKYRGVKSTSPKRVTDILIEQYSPPRKSYGAKLTEVKVNVEQWLEQTNVALVKDPPQFDALPADKAESSNQSPAQRSRTKKQINKAETPVRVSARKRNVNVTPAVGNSKKKVSEKKQSSQIKELANISSEKTDIVPELVSSVKKPARRNRRLWSERNEEDWHDKDEPQQIVLTSLNEEIVTHPALTPMPEKVLRKRGRPRIKSEEVKEVKETRTRSKRAVQQIPEIIPDENTEPSPAKRPKRKAKVQPETKENIAEKPKARGRRKVEVKEPEVEEPSVVTRTRATRRKESKSDEQDNVEVIKITRTRTTRKPSQTKLDDKVAEEPQTNNPSQKKRKTVKKTDNEIIVSPRRTRSRRKV